MQSPQQLTLSKQSRLASAESALKTAWVPLLAQRRERLAQSSGSLAALSPRGVLERGYAVLLSEDGRILSSLNDTLELRELNAVLPEALDEMGDRLAADRRIRVRDRFCNEDVRTCKPLHAS